MRSGFELHIADVENRDGRKREPDVQVQDICLLAFFTGGQSILM